MQTVMKWGAMYAELEEGDVVSTTPILLGEHVLLPGDLVTKIGKVKRTMIEMQDGYSLKYIGMVDGHLLFKSVPEIIDSPWHYAFAYVNPLVLIIGSHKGCSDIRVDELIVERPGEVI